MTKQSKADPGQDRRVEFFLVAGILSLVLYFPTPDEFRWVPTLLGGVYAALAALTALDQWSRGRR